MHQVLWLESGYGSSGSLLSPALGDHLPVEAATDPCPSLMCSREGLLYCATSGTLLTRNIMVSPEAIW